MAVMIAGGILVAGLVAWALTRSVEPAPVESTSTYAIPSTDTPPTPAPTASAPLTTRDFSIPPSGQSQDPDKAVVARVSAEDLYGQFSRGAVTIVDVRDADSYAKGHIPGALHIPMASIQTQLESLRTGKPIVAYCT